MGGIIGFTRRQFDALDDLLGSMLERIGAFETQVAGEIPEYVNDWLDEHPEATTTVEDGVVSLPKLASDTIEVIESKLGNGSYSTSLTAGAADGITGGGPTDTAAWTYRACPGTDGPATIESIRGNTLVWNQLVSNGDFSNGTSGWSSNHCSASVSDGVCSISPTGTYARVYKSNMPIVAGHKYLYSVEIKKTSAVKVAAIHSSGALTLGAVYSEASEAVGTWVKYANISGAASASGTNSLYVCDSQGFDTNTEYATRYVRNVMFIDLTAMFGAGNEPSTVAEFEALYPEPYYPYDAGSLLSVQMEGIETEDADGNVLMTRAIPATDLRSAGSVYDELTETQAVTRVGSVDLGTLAWGTNGTDSVYARGVPFNVANNNVVSAELETCDRSATADNMPDNSVKTSSGELVIVKKSGITPSNASTMLSGVILYYELDTPTTTPIDPPLNLTYRAAAGGAERIVHTDPTAPPTLVVTYGSTADGIRDRALSAIAPVENGLASANYGVGSYLIHGGQLCRVTTAIATGEAITIGTNVTATTVMAELLTLTQ